MPVIGQMIMMLSICRAGSFPVRISRSGAHLPKRPSLPHVLVEYSSNLDGQVDFPRFLTALRDTALSTGVFPLGGIRVRAYCADHYVIADGHPDNAFVHVMLRVGHGRDLETRKRACDAIFATACAQLEEAYNRIPLGISLEMQEVDAVLTCKKNNLHEYVKKRAIAGGAAGEGGGDRAGTATS